MLSNSFFRQIALVVLVQRKVVVEEQDLKSHMYEDDFSDLKIIPPVDWRECKIEFGEKANQFMFFIRERSKPKNIEQLVYVVTCCVLLNEDKGIEVVKKHCGFIDSVSHRRLVENLAIEVKELDRCEVMTQEEFAVQLDYFRSQVRLMDVPLTDDNMMRRARDSLAALENRTESATALVSSEGPVIAGLDAIYQV